jgi:hypothetical protein
MNRARAIRMTDEEVAAFLAAAHVICATNGTDGSRTSCRSGTS